MDNRPFGWTSFDSDSDVSLSESTVSCRSNISIMRDRLRAVSARIKTSPPGSTVVWKRAETSPEVRKDDVVQTDFDVKPDVPQSLPGVLKETVIEDVSQAREAILRENAMLEEEERNFEAWNTAELMKFEYEKKRFQEYKSKKLHDLEVAMQQHKLEEVAVVQKLEMERSQLTARRREFLIRQELERQELAKMFEFQSQYLAKTQEELEQVLAMANESEEEEKLGLAMIEVKLNTESIQEAFDKLEKEEQILREERQNLDETKAEFEKKQAVDAGKEKERSIKLNQHSRKIWQAMQEFKSEFDSSDIAQNMNSQLPDSKRT